MNLILALFLIVFEACSEGLHTGGHYLASEIVEVVYLSGITLIAFAWMNRTPWFTILPLMSFWKVLIGYLLLRFALFDIIWNISAGQDLFFYGTTKLYDRVMTELGSWGWFLKFIALIWGIAWLTNINNGNKITTMIHKIISSVFNTDSLPVLGGTTGALSQINKFMPEWGAICSLVVLTIIGTLTGYLVKLLLDWLFSKTKK